MAIAIIAPGKLYSYIAIIYIYNNNNNVLLNQDNYTIISYMGKGPRLRGTKQEPWQGIH